MMRHKLFTYFCPVCEQTGLRPDANAAYKVRICDACEGKGKARMTVKQYIELDQRLGGGIDGK